MSHTRPSDFMVDHFLAFARADPAHSAEWMNVYNKICAMVNYQFNSGGSAGTGLMPDFLVKSGANFVPVSGSISKLHMTVTSITMPAALPGDCPWLTLRAAKPICYPP